MFRHLHQYTVQMFLVSLNYFGWYWLQKNDPRKLYVIIYEEMKGKKIDKDINFLQQRIKSFYDWISS